MAAVHVKRVPDRASRTRTVTGVLLVSLATITIAVIVVFGVRTTVHEQSSPVASEWRGFDDFQQCLRSSLTRVVPHRANVYVNIPGNGFLQQQIDELIVPWATAVPRSEASYTVILVPGTECPGHLEVRVEPIVR